MLRLQSCGLKMVVVLKVFFSFGKLDGWWGREWEGPRGLRLLGKYSKKSVLIKRFFNDIHDRIAKDFHRGGYAFKFDSNHWLLRLNSWMTKLNIFSFRVGDQTLYFTKSLWDELSGYDGKFVVMEEHDLMRRAEQHGAKHDLLSGQVLVSARKHLENSDLKVQWVNFSAMAMFQKV